MPRRDGRSIEGHAAFAIRELPSYGDEPLGPSHHDAQAGERSDAQRALPSGFHDPRRRCGANPRNAEELLVIGRRYLDGKALHVPQCPIAFRVEALVQEGMGFVEYFRGGETIEAEKPIGLVKPVFPREGRLRDGGEPRVRSRGDEGRVIDAPHILGEIEIFGQGEDCRVGFGAGSDDELGCLAGGYESGFRVATAGFPGVEDAQGGARAPP